MVCRNGFGMVLGIVLGIVLEIVFKNGFQCILDGSVLGICTMCQVHFGIVCAFRMRGGHSAIAFGESRGWGRFICEHSDSRCGITHSSSFGRERERERCDQESSR